MANAGGIGRWLGDQPIRRKLALAAGAFGIVVVLLTLTGWFAMSTLSTVRAYVAGEGLWSKGQKDAATYLIRYAHSHDELDYRRYRTSIRVPLADKRARLELEKADPDFTLSDAAFIEARNDPADVHAMSLFFRRFRHVSYIDRAISLWAQGDDLIAELDRIAAEIERSTAAGAFDEAERARALERVDAVTSRLAILEDDFSFALGEGARWVTNVLITVMAAAAAVGSLFAFYVAYVVSGGILRGVMNLRGGTARVAAGDFGTRISVSSSDELGQLAGDFNEMTGSLVRSIEERRAAEGQLAAHARELEEAHQTLLETEQLKSAFFANVSHELRTPLSLIIAPLESMLEGAYGDLPPSTRGLLETMHNSAARLLQLLQGLLDFQKLESRKVEIRREPTDLGGLTRSIVADFEALFREHGLRHDLAVIESGAVVLIDRYAFERIVFNLLANAIKFTPKGGQIHVRLECKDDRAVISVRDTGIGIREEDQPKLFERFRQVEGASTRRFEGVGLGLALVKEFAELLGGGVSVESRVDEGSTFRVECAAPEAKGMELPPLARPKLRMAAERLPATAERLAPLAAGLPFSGEPRGRILIVEDNADLAQYIAGCLSRLSEIRIARDGEEALDVVRTWRPTVILSDVMMPRRDGLSMCRELKGDPDTRTIPIVLLTALTYRESLLRGWEAGADDYLFKPFHPTELVTRMHALLNSQLRLQKAEEALLSTSRQLAEAQQIAHIGSWEWDILEDQVSWSDELYRIFGLAPSSGPATYEGYLDRIAPSDRSIVHFTLQHALDTKEPFEFEHRIVREGGAVGWVLAQGRVVLDGHGAPVRMTGVARDITEQKQADESRLRLVEAQTARDLADQANRAKDEFLAIVSHELRTPLNAVLGWTNMLRSGQISKEKQQLALETIERNAANQARLIEDLLDLSRVVSGKLQLEREAVELGRVVGDVADDVRPRTTESGIRLDVAIADDAGAVFGDANRLRQVAFVLLDNALKFTPRGGAVAVALIRSGSKTKLKVTDTGRGIRHEFIPHVFERFWQADGSSTRSRGGLGIGLAIAKQLVEAHGGTIEVASPGEGLGATFTVTLPRLTRETSAASTRPSLPAVES